MSHPRRSRASRHRSSRNRAATSEFQVPVHIAIGYHELAVPLTTVPAPTGNLTLITPRLIIGSARFRSCSTPPLLLLAFRSSEKRDEKEEEEEEWNGNVNFEEGNFTEQRVTVKFANNVTGTDKRAKIKGGRRERAEREGRVVKRFLRENNFMHVPGKSLAKRWKSSIKSLADARAVRK